MHHAPTHHEHESNENVVIRIIRKTSQHLPFVNHSVSLKFLDLEMFLPLKVHHFNLTLECEMLPPFKVHDFNLIGDRLL
jgi:hypothetical protein